MLKDVLKMMSNMLKNIEEPCIFEDWKDLSVNWGISDQHHIERWP